MPEATAYRFENYILDTGRGTLLRDGEEVPLRRQSFDVLVHLVENRGRLVTREELLAAVWPDTVVTDASITQCLVDIRAALDDQNHDKIRTLTRRGYRFELPVTGSSPAWSARAPAAGDETAARDAPRRVIRWPAGLAAMAVVFAGAWWALETRDSPVTGQDLTASPGAVVIAALPLENLAPEAQDDAFVVGFQDALAAELGRHPRIQLVGRWSIESLGDDAAYPEVLREYLGADYALTGSASRDRASIRFSFQLHDTATGRQAWAESYVEPLGARELIALQQAVAKSVAREASAGVTGDAVGFADSPRNAPHFPKTDSLEAYERYLDGLVHFRRIESGQHTPEILEAGRREFEAAMAADPRWAPPRAELARMLSFVASTGLVPDAWRESLAQAERAVELDPDYAPAHMQLGFIAYYWNQDYAAAERHFARAQALGEPSYWARGILAGSLGRFDESIELYRQALLGDPLNPSIRSQYARSLFCGQRWERAAEVLEGLAGHRDDEELQLEIAYAEFKAGRIEQGLARAAPYRNRAPYWDGLFHFELDDRPGAVAALERLAATDPVPLPQAASLALRLGEKQRALRWLERRSETHPGSLRWILCDPPLRAMEGDPRFDAVLEIIGLRPTS